MVFPWNSFASIYLNKNFLDTGLNLFPSFSSFVRFHTFWCFLCAPKVLDYLPLTSATSMIDQFFVSEPNHSSKFD
jgi:hypothetical protein